MKRIVAGGQADSNLLENCVLNRLDARPLPDNLRLAEKGFVSFKAFFGVAPWRRNKECP